MRTMAIVMLALTLVACGTTADEEQSDPTAQVTIEAATESSLAQGDSEATATTRPSPAAPTNTPEPEPTNAPSPTPEPTPTKTPTPRPTNTPSPTATPEPTATPSPTPEPPTPTPVPQPAVYSGVGANVIDIQKPGGPGGAALVYVRGNAESRHFAVESYDASGNQLDLLVNTTDPYEGITLLDIRNDDETTRLQVTATGEWYIEVRPLASATRVAIPGSISGMSDDVFIIDGDPDVAHIVGNPDGRHFAVTAYGDRSNLLVNTTDPFDGRVIVAGDAVLVEVDAEGAWTITFE